MGLARRLRSLDVLSESNPDSHPVVCAGSLETWSQEDVMHHLTIVLAMIVAVLTLFIWNRIALVPIRAVRRFY
jgi:hypothetical protein